MSAKHVIARLYNVGAFQSPDVTDFFHDNNHNVGKLKHLLFVPYPLTI